MHQPVDGIDARTDRVAQGAVGVTVLAGFVFRVPWVVPVLAVVLVVAALAGPHANGLHYVFERWVGPRLPGRSARPSEVRVAEVVVRAQDALAGAILVVASLAFALGIALVAWALAIAEAVIAITAATTGIHLAERVRRRL